MLKKIAKVGLVVGYTYVVATVSYYMGVRYVQIEFEGSLDKVVTGIAQEALKGL